MAFLKKRYFFSLSLGLLILAVGLMSFVFYFTSFYIVPDKLEATTNQLCAQHLEDKSYQIKQLILENINNSKLWLANRKNSFFDSHWFAISYYEHNGKEWLLKDFKINPIVLNIYKLNPSDYIKAEQALVFPHPQSEQISLQEANLASLPLLVMDVPNLLPNVSTLHEVRIQLFTDTILGILNSDPRCQLNILDNRGNFVLNSKRSISSNVSLQAQKIFKNILVSVMAESQKNSFRGVFWEIILFSLLVVSVLIFLIGKMIYEEFHLRIKDVKKNIQLLKEPNSRGNFNMSHQDEFSSLEEEISHISDEIKKRK